MLQFKRFSLFKKLIIPLSLLIIMVIYNGCKKNNYSEEETITDLSVIQAKSWYESTYPSNDGIKSTFHTSSIGTGSETNLSEKIRPDWHRAKTYTRFNNDVIEMPLDSASRFSSVLKNMSVNRIIGRKEYNRSSFILIKNGSKYEAYIMTLIADSAYLKNDLSKLARNTYKKRDDNYSGLVLYFTPKGKYVSGWRYKNGHLITQQKQVESSPETKTQTIESSKLKQLTNTTITCYHWYWITEVDGEITSVTYMYTECFGGGSDGGGGSGSTGDSPVPPRQCPVYSGSANNVYKTLGNTGSEPGPTSGGDDGGFPPPAPDQPCIVPESPEQDIINDVKDSCLHKMVEAVLSQNIKGQINALIQSVFGQNPNLNLTFTDQIVPSSPNRDAETVSEFNSNNELINAQIRLRPSILARSSQEFIAASIMHEALHAFMDSQGIDLDQHNQMAENYLNTMASDLKVMFPGMNDTVAYSLAWEG